MLQNQEKHYTYSETHTADKPYSISTRRCVSIYYKDPHVCTCMRCVCLVQLSHADVHVHALVTPTVKHVCKHMSVCIGDGMGHEEHDARTRAQVITY